MNIVLTAVVSIFVFGIIIFIHELGHFLTAKWSGIQVNEFSIGMGPQILKWGKGETQYSLRLLPIGGFVSMEGEDEDPEDGENKDFAPKDNKRSYQNAPVWKRMIVIATGAFMNLLLGFLVLLFLVSQEEYITSKTVSSFYENASTQASGLMVGDEIIAVNGRRCFIADDIIYEFARTQNGTAALTVMRDGQKIELYDVVFETATMEDGTERLIIDFTVLPVEKTFFTILKEGWNWTLSLSRLVFLSLLDLVTGNVPMNSLSGPIGIVSVIGEATSAGIQPILLILALISINLGVFNIMPLPALDGGKLVFLAIEGIRKKPLNPKYEIWVNTAGFAMLMLLMIFVTFNDVTRLFFS